MVEYDNIHFIYFMVDGVVYCIDIDDLTITCMDTNDIYELLPNDHEFYFSVYNNQCLSYSGNLFYV